MNLVISSILQMCEGAVLTHHARQPHYSNSGSMLSLLLRVLIQYHEFTYSDLYCYDVSLAASSTDVGFNWVRTTIELKHSYSIQHISATSLLVQSVSDRTWVRLSWRLWTTKLYVSVQELYIMRAYVLCTSTRAVHADSLGLSGLVFKRHLESKINIEGEQNK